MRLTTASVSLLVLLAASFVAADDAGSGNVHPHVHLDEAKQAGACDRVVTDKYMAIVNNLETQHTEQLEQAKASCQLQLSSAEESVQEYKDLADQAQQELDDLQVKLEQELEAAGEEKKQVEEELELLSTKHADLESRHVDIKSELEAAQDSLTVSREKIASLQTDLEQAQKDLDEIQNMYINRHLIKRRYQETKDAVEFFYSGKLVPFLVSTKEATINIYTQAVAKYHELCVALEPVWEAIGKLAKQTMEQASVMWQQLITFASPHVEKARMVFDEKAGPHVAVAAEKLQSFKTESIQKLQDSPVYPHMLKATSALEQVQRHIAGGLFTISKKVLSLLEQYEAPERLVGAASYVKDHSRDVAIYLEASIATLLMVLILNSVLGGGSRAKRRAKENGSTAKNKVKKA